MFSPSFWVNPNSTHWYSLTVPRGGVPDTAQSNQLGYACMTPRASSNNGEIPIINVDFLFHGISFWKPICTSSDIRKYIERFIDRPGVHVNGCRRTRSVKVRSPLHKMSYCLDALQLGDWITTGPFWWRPPQLGFGSPWPLTGCPLGQFKLDDRWLLVPLSAPRSRASTECEDKDDFKTAWVEKRPTFIFYTPTSAPSGSRVIDAFPAKAHAKSDTEWNSDAVHELEVVFQVVPV